MSIFGLFVRKKSYLSPCHFSSRMPLDNFLLMERLLKFFGNNVAVFILISILGLVVFSSVLHGDFLYDDRVLIVENSWIRSFEHIADFFVSNAARGANVLDTNLYRPLINVIHTVIYSLVGLETFLYHLVNVFVHILNAFLVYIFIRRLSLPTLGALMMALIFVAHPIQAESVGYAAGLPDILSTTFMLVGFNMFLRIGEEYEKVDERFWDIIGMSMLLIAAFLSKELTVVFAPILCVLAAYKWRGYNGSTKSYVKKFLGVAWTLTIIYLILKFTVLNFVGDIALNTNTNAYTENVSVRIYTFLNMIPEYFRLMFWPVHLYFEKPVIAYTFLGQAGIIGIFVILFGAIGAVFSYMKERVFMLGYLIFFIGLAPVTGILIPANFMYADHWLYIPIIGVLVIFASLFKFARGRMKMLFVALSILVIGLFGYRLYERNKEWADPILFFENEIEYFPSARVYNHLGYEYMQILKTKTAVGYFHKAIELDDTYPHPHFHLANFYYAGGNIEKALDEFYIGLSLRPNHIATLTSIGIIADNLGKDQLAGEIHALLTYIDYSGPITFEDIPARSRFND